MSLDAESRENWHCSIVRMREMDFLKRRWRIFPYAARGKRNYARTLVELVARVGSAPSAAGARAPLAGIIKHATGGCCTWVCVSHVCFLLDDSGFFLPRRFSTECIVPPYGSRLYNVINWTH